MDGLLVALHYPRHHFISSSAHLHVFILTQAKWEEKQSQQVPTDELPRHDSQQSHGASWRRRPGLQAPWSPRASARAGDERCSRRGGFILRCVINKAAGLPEGKLNSPFITSPHHSKTDLCARLPVAGVHKCHTLARFFCGGFLGVFFFFLLKCEENICNQLETGSMCPVVCFRHETWKGCASAVSDAFWKSLPSGLPGNPGLTASILSEMAVGMHSGQSRELHSL